MSKKRDKVNEFLKELAPMKEWRFWHDFIARLMMTNDGKGEPPNTKNWLGHEPSREEGEGYLESESDDNSCSSLMFMTTNNEFRHQNNNGFDCYMACCNHKTIKNNELMNDDIKQHQQPELHLNPPATVYVKCMPVIQYPTIIMSPTPPPVTPTPTPPPIAPKPKFYQPLQQPRPRQEPQNPPPPRHHQQQERTPSPLTGIYSPPPATRIAPAVRKYNSYKTWIPIEQEYSSTSSCSSSSQFTKSHQFLQQKITNNNYDHMIATSAAINAASSHNTNKLEEEKDIFYCCFETPENNSAVVNKFLRRQPEEIMGEETCTTPTTTDTLTEDQTPQPAPPPATSPTSSLVSSSTITNANGNIDDATGDDGDALLKNSNGELIQKEETTTADSGVDENVVVNDDVSLTTTTANEQQTQQDVPVSVEPTDEITKSEPSEQSKQTEESSEESEKKKDSEDKLEEESKPEPKQEETKKEETKQEESKPEEQPQLKPKEEKKEPEQKSPRIVQSKPPLKRSLSEPGSAPPAQQPHQPALNMLQKSPSRPIFTSSSFYDPSQHPTLEDQVKLCREIAKQLVSDCANEKSKGREMFERRVQKSVRWVTENEDSFQNYTTSEEDFHERTITDENKQKDINTVQGVNEHIIVTQEAKTRDTCKTIVNDLTSPEVNPNRGNALFAKRVQRSEEWVVDDVHESARDHMFRNVKQYQASPPPPQQYIGYSNPAWSTPPQSSPIPPPMVRPLNIAGPVFTPVSTWSPLSSRPSSSMSIMSQFKDFNARPKPFCRAY